MSDRHWNPLLGKFEDFTPVTTDNKTIPYPTESLTAPALARCTKCGRLANELYTNFVYPEELLCPECWRATQPVTTFTVVESKEERCYKKLKKWLKKVMKGKSPVGDNALFWGYERTLDKMKKLEKEERK